MKTIVMILLFLVTKVASKKHYEGYELLSIDVTSDKDVEILHSIERDFHKLDFWQRPANGRTCTVLSPPALLPGLKTSLTDHGIAWTRKDVDVDRLIQAGMERNPTTSREKRSTDSDLIDHHNYHDYDQMIDYINQLHSAYPSLVNVSYLPYFTHEGRRMITFKLHGAPGSNPKKSILVEAGIHAREWISPAATLYSVEKMLQEYKARNQVVRLMLDSFDWHFVPVTNPDGYQYTRRGPETRLWRKNRRMQYFDCEGVDLNRNFDSYWGTTGVSDNCSSNVYPGVKAFSEPETVNIKHLFSSLNKTLAVYLSVHSYSQFILVPWSYSNANQVPATYNKLKQLADDMSDTIEKTHGKIYLVGQAYDLLDYAASGSSADWALEERPEIYSYTYELRPDYNDTRGFNLPPNEIIPTGQELLASIKTMILGL